jgi:AAA family ATP:ADP antiporter
LTSQTHTTSHSAFERFLRLFADVRSREGSTACILIGNIFLILAAYYLIKPVREGWLAISVLQGFTSLEVKAYSAFGQSVLLFLVLPIYAGLATRWTRRQLITRVGLFFGAILLLFWITQPGFIFTSVPYLGLAFYLFVGVFSVTLVAQFWSFASDLYGPERGKRLFPLVAIGASAGAVFGSWIGESFVKSNLVDPFDLILFAIAPLAAAILFANWSDKRGTYGQPSQGTTDRWSEPAAPEGEGSFNLIRRYRYLSATAAMTLIFSWVVASGDNILFGYVQQTLQDELTASGASAEARTALLRTATTAFYGNLYFWINLIGLMLQAFIVSRILRYAGFGWLMLATPLVSLAAYASMLVTPLLSIIKVMKIAENSSNYSVNNTARHILWLPTTKEMLYQAKPTIDTLFVRLGDGLAALTVLFGTRIFELSIINFVTINLVLIVMWLAIAGFLVREHKKWNTNGPST